MMEANDESTTTATAPGRELVGDTAWIGSIGYERFASNSDFASALAEARVEVLVDVRDLPISRKPGFGKTALAEAVEQLGIEYFHWKGLGNPKPIRDIYKAGDVERGRGLYERLLADERAEDLAHLSELITRRRVALMCVEHDERVCHRHSILTALRAGGRALEVGRLLPAWGAG